MAILASIDVAKVRRWSIRVAFAISIVWTIVSWSGGFSYFFDILIGTGIVGAFLVFLDGVWVLGLAMQFVGAGKALGITRKPPSWIRAVRRVRAFKSEAIDSVARAKLVWLGFYLNAAAAFSFALVAPFVVIFALPHTLWFGFMLFLVADTAGTVFRVIPQKRAMEARMGKLVFHTARPEDLDGYLEAQRTSWEHDNAADRAMLESRFNIHPHGIFIAEKDGVVVGAVTTIRLKEYDADNPPDWYEVTGDGFCTTHQPDGKIMFGVDMSATKNAPKGVHDDLLIQCMRQCIRENLKFGILGGRLPGYHKHSHAMSAEEYLWTRRGDGKFLDPQVRMYDGFPLLKVKGVLPNYFQDPESLNNGVLLVWRNPFYGVPGRRLWAWLMVTAVSIMTKLS